MKLTLFDGLILDNGVLDKKDFFNHYTKFEKCLREIDGNSVTLSTDFTQIKKKLLPESNIEPENSLTQTLSDSESEFLNQLSKDTETLWNPLYSSSKIRLEFKDCINSSFLEKFGESYEYKAVASTLNLDYDPELLSKINLIAENTSLHDLGILFKIKAAYSVSSIFCSLAVSHKFAMVFGISYFFTFLHSIFYNKTKQVVLVLVNNIIASFYTKKIFLSTQARYYSFTFKYISNSALSLGRVFPYYVFSYKNAIKNIVNKELIRTGGILEDFLFKRTVRILYETGLSRASVPRSVLDCVPKSWSDKVNKMAIEKDVRFKKFLQDNYTLKWCPLKVELLKKMVQGSPGTW